MAQLTLTHTLVAGTNENVNDVQGNFDDIVAWSSTLSETNLSSSSGLFASYNTLQTVCGWVGATGAPTAGSYFFTEQNPTNTNASNLVKSAASNIGNGVPAIYFDDADYAMTGKTLKLRVRAQCYVNTAGPAVTLTAGLYPVSAIGGTTDNVAVTLGAVTAGSTVAFASPGASSTNQGNSGDFAAPADGHYLLGLALSGTPAANNGNIINVQLQQRWV